MRIRGQIRRGRRGEQGYVMMFLLLTMALMAIFAATLVTSITFDIKREREGEMIHRGVQYSRAIRAYYKKLGRYPVSLDNLENTRQQRFLRKRYKDPESCLAGVCRDFKLLHFGEAKLMGGGLGGGTIPGASTIGPNGTLTNAGQGSGFGGNSAFGANGNSAIGQNSQANAPAPGTDASTTGTGTPGTDSQGSQKVSPNGSDPTDRSAANQPVQFGGGPIVGVASTSKSATIREYDKKRKYSDWQFVYDPSLDRGLITTPYQPSLMIGQGMQNLNGQNGAGQNNNNNGGFGNGGFGNGGFGNNGGFGSSGPGAPGNGTLNSPTAPTNPPPSDTPAPQ